MSKKKHLGLKIAGTVLLIAILGGVFYINRLMPIITGYAAKNLASGIFVAHRTQQSMEQNDLNFSFIKYTHNTVDYDKKEVTSRFLWAKSKAVYVNGFGCILVRGISADSIRHKHYTRVPLSACNPDTVAWPMGDRLTDTIPQGMNMNKLNTALQKAFNDSVGTKGTYAVAIAYKDQLVAEKYRKGFSSTNRFLSWSMGKSFTQALVGIMVKKGLLDINAPADIAVWQNDSRKNITIDELMHMNSGLQWNEDYGNQSDVTVMLHEKADMAKYTYDKPAQYSPDSVWYYSSGATNVVSYLIREALNNDSVYWGFPRTELFNPIGMRSAIFEPDASGTFVGSSYLYATMRDYVRFGLLYLHGGNWLGNQILPEGWTDYTVQPAKGAKGGYGSFFWLKKANDFPGVPSDLSMCRGHDGQYIYIIPSLNLVVVRTGFSKHGEFDDRAFIASIVACVE